MTVISQMGKLRLREPRKLAHHYKLRRLPGSAAQPGYLVAVFPKRKWCPSACIFSFKPDKNPMGAGRVLIIVPKLKSKGANKTRLLFFITSSRWLFSYSIYFSYPRTCPFRVYLSYVSSRTHCCRRCLERGQDLGLEDLSVSLSSAPSGCSSLKFRGV